MITYKSKRYFPFKRWIELIIHIIIFLIIYSILDYIGFFDLSNYNEKSSKLDNYNCYYQLFFWIGCVFIWKNLSTPTPVDLIEIDIENKTISINYSLFHIKPKQKSICFKDFSFKHRAMEPYIIGGTIALYFYSKGKFISKINARNGWGYKEIEEIKELLIEICFENDRPFKINGKKYNTEFSNNK